MLRWTLGFLSVNTKQGRERHSHFSLPHSPTPTPVCRLSQNLVVDSGLFVCMANMELLEGENNYHRISLHLPHLGWYQAFPACERMFNDILEGID